MAGYMIPCSFAFYYKPEEIIWISCSHILVDLIKFTSSKLVMAIREEGVAGLHV